MSSAHLKKFASVKPAEIEWRDDAPFSLEFNDVYFSTEGGLAESNHVFIEGTQLNNDWKNSAQQHFYLVELGFGSALNFLVTAAQWQKHRLEYNAAQPQHLHYIAIEKRPFLLADLTHACATWPQFADIAQQLQRLYPSITYGRHKLNFPTLQLTLTLFFMPVDEALEDLLCESKYQQQKLSIDHWFMDGFAPQKNISMWSDIVCQKISRLSKIGSRLATFSVAGVVKNSLKTAGFQLTKRKGIGRKREVLSAVLVEKMEPQPQNFINLKFDSPWFNYSLSQSADRVAIIGAGVAGCATAYSLTSCGIAVDIFESGSSIASQASAAAAGIFHPNLTPDMNLSSQFSWQAYLTLLRFLDLLDESDKQKISFNKNLTRLLPSEKKSRQFLLLSEQLGLQAYVKDANSLTDNRRAVEFPHSGALNISAFCQLLLDRIPQTKANVNLYSHIENFNFVDEQWHLSLDGRRLIYDHVVFCGGARSDLLEKIAPDITHISRGQSCYINDSFGLNHSLCEQIYLVPDSNGKTYVGATFDNYIDDQLNRLSQDALLEKLETLLAEINVPRPENFSSSNLPLRGSLGYRLHTRDRLPLVGGAIDLAKFATDFKDVGQKRLTYTPSTHYNRKGLWLNTAYGSHGLLYSLLASDHLASLITNSLSPLNNQLSLAIHPARFYIKNLLSKKHSKKTSSN